MSYDQKGFHRHVDESVLRRDQEDAIARLRTALFVAVLGPLAIGAFWFFKWPIQGWMTVGIYATAPAGFILGIINWIRIPGGAKTHGRTIRLLALTLAAAVATIPLAHKFLPQ